MTTRQANADPMEPQDSQPLPSYHIDEAWLEQSGRSLQHMIESRVGAPPAADEKAPKRRKKAVSMADLAKIEGFVSPESPMLEAVFRLLLVHQNKPMDVEQISHELAERGIGIRDARSVRPETLIRILDHDAFYGLRRA